MPDEDYVGVRCLDSTPFTRSPSFEELPQALVIDSGAPAVPVRELATVAFGGPALLDAVCRFGGESALLGLTLAPGDAFRCLLVQLLCD